MLNGARVCFEEGISHHRCRPSGAVYQSYFCMKLMYDFGMTYLKLKKHNAAEDILLQARKYYIPFREHNSGRHWTSQSVSHNEYEVVRGLAEVQIGLHKYSEALSSLEEVLDECVILLLLTPCAKWPHDSAGHERIRVAIEVLDIYHSLYINVPDSLHETV